MGIKAKVVDLDNQPSGEIELDEKVFGLPPRPDILARVVNWPIVSTSLGSTGMMIPSAMTSSSTVTSTKASPALLAGVVAAATAVGVDSGMGDGSSSGGAAAKAGLGDFRNGPLWPLTI